MALGPDDDKLNEQFQREVDEKMREDQMADFMKKYGTWITLGVIAFLAAIGGYLFWQNEKEAKAAEASEQLALAIRDVGNGDLDGVPERLDAIAADSTEATKASALLTRAAVALQQGDRAKAIETYAAVVGYDSIPQAYRDIALIRQTMLEYDRMEPDAIIARLQPMAQPGHAFYGTAAELTAIAMIRADRNDEAGRLFAAIAADETVPETLRNRAGQVAGSLGVDASDARIPEEDEE